jgi:hypothetical protein
MVIEYESQAILDLENPIQPVNMILHPIKSSVDQ